MKVFPYLVTKRSILARDRAQFWPKSTQTSKWIISACRCAGRPFYSAFSSL